MTGGELCGRRTDTMIPSDYMEVRIMARERRPCVYMLASRRNGTLYVGVTSNLVQRVWQHRDGAVPGFTRCYHVHDLVWFEMHESMESAIRREKALKEWRRAWKLDLIERENPDWHDLYPGICD
jgi:putative endonuclease